MQQLSPRLFAISTLTIGLFLTGCSDTATQTIDSEPAASTPPKAPLKEHHEPRLPIAKAFGLTLGDKFDTNGKALRQGRYTFEPVDP